MYQVRALDAKGAGSFLSDPWIIMNSKNVFWVEAEVFAPRASYGYKGFNGSGFVEISASKNRVLTFEVNVEKAGTYALSFVYANGNGPINTENKCALRSLYVNDGLKGAILFPQRGTNEWSSWGETNSRLIYLALGKQKISLRMEEWNENMNIEINQAMIDQMLLRFLHP
jgi:hypothetical protein